MKAKAAPARYSRDYHRDTISAIVVDCRKSYKQEQELFVRPMNVDDLQDAIRAGHMLAGGHAALEAAADSLTLDEIWKALLDRGAEIIEDYPTDPRGSICLLYCEVQGRAEHVVIAFPSLRAAQQRGYASLAFLVTCYRPGGPKHAAKWSPDFKKRVVP